MLHSTSITIKFQLISVSSISFRVFVSLWAAVVSDKKMDWRSRKVESCDLRVGWKWNVEEFSLEFDSLTFSLSISLWLLFSVVVVVVVKMKTEYYRKLSISCWEFIKSKERMRKCSWRFQFPFLLKKFETSFFYGFHWRAFSFSFVSFTLHSKFVYLTCDLTKRRRALQHQSENDEVT